MIFFFGFMSASQRLFCSLCSGLELSA